MKNVFWLIVGIGAGFVVAHEINKTQSGKRFFSELDSRVREFTDTVGDAYKEREAQLRDTAESVVARVEDAAEDLTKP
ncbi:hypothetical protein ITJ66_11140 [Plantibacter sp. VKM Ac-2885]|uniref:Uncharacterized protein n=1 Tax=Plantibacter flavus TaxID=150123 RepID=A0A1S7B9C0_9MICO|nr:MULTISPECIES: hypothetical protein [Plantibacter]AQX80292.1 hypothetical protein BWO91_10190 [Plantibacter flavus]MBD8102979.1 hypothetical protein [Plantibacter sp. CFBP 8775]MBD8515551.1 hypothetical protein [Plantibacter sp. CFBP 8804]MBF4513033.1 hypothetical protein [Plantibacter sp. VKM Ac-2885]MBF4564962.1 hypothetical protein [Plantibacter sp. VKM Ac-2876]